MTGVGLRRTALVTGGARRVGRAIVEDLAAHGWAVAIHHGRSGQEAADLCAAVRAAGGTAATVGGDLADLRRFGFAVDRGGHGSVFGDA